MNWAELFKDALSYGDFLDHYGQPGHAQRWKKIFDQVRLTTEQRELLGSFQRDMNVLCLAGAWCGDCVNQCPIFEHFARANQRIRLQFLDRDDYPDIQQELSINAGHRVPSLVFLSEDFHEVARYGDRTLTRYRQLAQENLGPSCPTGIAPPDDESLVPITQDWLNEFERIHLILRLSTRLRQKHGD